MHLTLRKTFRGANSRPWKQRRVWILAERLATVKRKRQTSQGVELALLVRPCAFYIQLTANA